MKTESKIESYLFLLGAGLCWGPSYLFIKVAVPEIPPFTLVFLRVFIGCLLLYSFCHLNKHKILSWKHHTKQFAVMALTLNVIPFSLINFGELTIASSLAGALNGLTVVFTALISHFFTHDRMTKRKTLAIGTGLLGLVAIYLPYLLQQSGGGVFGPLFIVLACVSYGTGTVYARKHLEKVPSLIALTAQLCIASIILLPLSLIFENPFSLPMPSWQAMGGALGLGILGTGAGFFFYFRMIHLAGPTFASFSTLIIPIVALILGALILHEQITWSLYLGTALILLSIIVLNARRAKS